MKRIENTFVVTGFVGNNAAGHVMGYYTGCRRH